MKKTSRSTLMQAWPSSDLSACLLPPAASIAPHKSQRSRSDKDYRIHKHTKRNHYPPQYLCQSPPAYIHTGTVDTHTDTTITQALAQVEKVCSGLIGTLGGKLSVCCLEDLTLWLEYSFVFTSLCLISIILLHIHFLHMNALEKHQYNLLKCLSLCKSVWYVKPITYKQYSSDWCSICD